MIHRKVVEINLGDDFAASAKFRIENPIFNGLYTATANSFTSYGVVNFQGKATTSSTCNQSRDIAYLNSSNQVTTDFEQALNMKPKSSENQIRELWPSDHPDAASFDYGVVIKGNIINQTSGMLDAKLEPALEAKVFVLPIKFRDSGVYGKASVMQFRTNFTFKAYLMVALNRSLIEGEFVSKSAAAAEETEQYNDELLQLVVQQQYGADVRYISEIRIEA